MNNSVKNLRKAIEQMIADNDPRIKLEERQPDCHYKFQYYIVDESVFGECIKVTIYIDGTYNIYIVPCVAPKHGTEIFAEYYSAHESERATINKANQCK